MKVYENRHQQHLHKVHHCNTQTFSFILALHTSWEVLVGGHGKAVQPHHSCPLLHLSFRWSLLTYNPTTSLSFHLEILTVAKITVLLNWKDRTKLSINHWLNLAQHTRPNQERLMSTLKDKVIPPGLSPTCIQMWLLAEEILIKRWIRQQNSTT